MDGLFDRNDRRTRRHDSPPPKRAPWYKRDHSNAPKQSAATPLSGKNRSHGQLLSVFCRCWCLIT